MGFKTHRIGIVPEFRMAPVPHGLSSLDLTTFDVGVEELTATHMHQNDAARHRRFAQYQGQVTR